MNAPRRVERVDWTDLVILEIFDLHEAAGLSLSQVALRYGVSRSAIGSIIKRVRDDLARSEAAGPRAVSPGNRDGDLGRRWWARGQACAG